MKRKLVRPAGFGTTNPKIQAKRMEGKTVLIAGAATGIGEATARLFAAHGARVVVADVQEEAGARVAAELGNGSEFIRCDVQSEDDVVAAVDRAVALGAKNVLDVFHYNASNMDVMGPINELGVEEFDHTLRGAVLCMKQAARVMKLANKGSIIFTGSVTSVQGSMGTHVYGISESAMVGLLRSPAAVELRRFGIRVNMVALHITPDSGLASAQRHVADGSLLRGHSLGAVGVADAALFFASEESRYISGQNLVIDA